MTTWLRVLFCKPFASLAGKVGSRLMRFSDWAKDGTIGGRRKRKLD